MFLDIANDVINDHLFLSLGVLLVAIIGFSLVKSIFHFTINNFFLSKEVDFAKLISIEEINYYGNISDMYAYGMGTDAFVPVKQFKFEFIMNDILYFHYVPYRLYERAVEGGKLAIVYSTTRLTKEIIIKDIYFLKGKINK